MKKTKTKKRTLLVDFTGNPEEPRRRHAVSASGVDVKKVTKTDEKDNERFKIQYECSMILRNIRDISR